MDETTKIIGVIDNGSYTIKSGFAGDDAPKKIFPSVVGYAQRSAINEAMDARNYYCGEAAKERRGRLKLVQPIKDSIVSNWEDIEDLWSYTFYEELKISPEESYTVISDSPLNPNKYREKTIEILFDLFNFEGVNLINKDILALYASGRATGCVIDSGYGVTYSVPIFEGYVSPNSVQSLNIGGRHLDEYLNKILLTKGYEFTTSLELEIVSQIKEELCIMKEDARFKPNDNEFKIYQLPDDSLVRLSSERYNITEILFNPKLFDINEDGIHEIMYKSILRCCDDIQPEMLRNIILTGGNTLFENFKERLLGEIIELRRDKNGIQIIAPKERLYATWIGGSIIGSLETFEDMSITRKEYEEYGCRIIHDKTF